ncbi:MAG: right-handed parallel beta-helix repeat-containing protein [Chloroflexi bacterium]|nr:right-handed parallel beta-helix repeat-containing protein [Chloroflexota bacterium]
MSRRNPTVLTAFGFGLLVLVAGLWLLQAEFPTITYAQRQTLVEDERARRESPQPQGSTIPGGTINSHTVWTLAGSPYTVTGDIVVAPGINLTIDPGVVVKFYQGVGLSVEGGLIAMGSGGNPIIFTDFRDDTAGGDTNGDGNGSSPGPGWWRGIDVQDGGTATLDYGTVRYGGYYAAPFTQKQSNLSKAGAGSLSLTHSTLSDSAYYGLRLADTFASQIISGTTVISNSGMGVWIRNTGSNVTFRENTVQANGDSGVYSSDNGSAIQVNTILSNTNFGIFIDGATSPALVKGNTLSGNSGGAIGLAAPNSGIAIDADNAFTGPLHVNGGSLAANTTWINNRVYYTRGDITVNDGATLIGIERHQDRHRPAGSLDDKVIFFVETLFD